MFERPNHSNLYLGYVDPARPDAWESHPVQVFVQKIKTAGSSVVIFTEDKSRTLYSLKTGDTLENVRNDLSRCVQKHLEQGAI